MQCGQFLFSLVVLCFQTDGHKQQLPSLNSGITNPDEPTTLAGTVRGELSEQARHSIVDRRAGQQSRTHQQVREAPSPQPSFVKFRFNSPTHRLAHDEEKGAYPIDTVHAVRTTSTQNVLKTADTDISNVRATDPSTRADSQVDSHPSEHELSIPSDGANLNLPLDPRLTPISGVLSPPDDSQGVLSLLKDAFLINNPGMPLRGNLNDHPDSFPGWQPRLNVPQWLQPSPSKRDKEVVVGTNGAGDGSEQQEVEQRSSWRCTFPDVLMGEDDLPWTCRERFVWRHLGEHIYPSRLYEAQCLSRTCWFNHFNCTPITYTLHVLERCRGCQDSRVPGVLRSEWQWNDLNVTVGCQCIR